MELLFRDTYETHQQKPSTTKQVIVSDLPSVLVLVEMDVSVLLKQSNFWKEDVKSYWNMALNFWLKMKHILQNYNTEFPHIWHKFF